ncbi:hypothetical protein BGW36DRAFT_368554 [Talaromyces proteolyticus]|uniref:Uncharacterized protein n=1 Tax=Talaromyces proteolyticus TaxID=1131652 RepID=A0AAD4Q6U3_9EURO|nr:uncharacterized protein BGW36DRAFT_368554 [Talaromyces proteolyticus]KAH8706003.1 hypothetical protein BGW36DRAFT_368554 [Talaromyces proteolyticus]
MLRSEVENCRRHAFFHCQLEHSIVVLWNNPKGENTFSEIVSSASKSNSVKKSSADNIATAHNPHVAYVRDDTWYLICLPYGTSLDVVSRKALISQRIAENDWQKQAALRNGPIVCLEYGVAPIPAALCVCAELRFAWSVLSKEHDDTIAHGCAILHAQYDANPYCAMRSQ